MLGNLLPCPIYFFTFDCTLHFHHIMVGIFSIFVLLCLFYDPVMFFIGPESQEHPQPTISIADEKLIDDDRNVIIVDSGLSTHYLLLNHILYFLLSITTGISTIYSMAAMIHSILNRYSNLLIYAESQEHTQAAVTVAKASPKSGVVSVTPAANPRPARVVKPKIPKTGPQRFITATKQEDSLYNNVKRYGAARESNEHAKKIKEYV